MRVFCIANQKGGCAKTTTAINLAASLCEKGHRVLLVDLDPQTHATAGLGVKSDQVEKSMYNVLTSVEGKKNLLEEVTLHLWDNFDLAAGHVLLSTLEQELIGREDAISTLYKALDSLYVHYDFVVIDCPPSLGFLTFNALRASHELIVPVQCCAFTLMGVGKLLNMVELLQLKLHRAPRVMGLVTAFDKRTRLARDMFEDIRKFFSNNLFESVIRTNVTLREAVQKGVPAYKVDKRSRGAMDYMSLADEVMRESKRLFLDDFYKDAERFMSEIRTTLRVYDFVLRMPDARDVHVVGDFNEWKVGDESRLQRRPDGIWEKRMALKTGVYKYKYVIDGEWCPDPHNIKSSSNPFGGVDSILSL